MTSARYKVSVAVDIGGTSTGYAIKSFDRDSVDILYSQWNNNEGHKTKTCALFNPAKEFVAFGQEAEMKLMELRQRGKDTKWFLFDNIKRVLLEKCTQDTTIVTKNRRWMYATDVFEALFGFFRQHVLGACESHGYQVEAFKIQWIYLIPSGTEGTTGAILQQCALKAGFEEEQFLFVSDTRSVAKYMVTAYGPHLEDVFKEGSKFMICDLGGKSIDIGAYKIRGDGTLNEEHTTHDVQHGSDSIVDAYLGRLAEFLGANVIQALKDYYPQAKDELVRLLYEDMKYMTSEMEESSAVSLRIPLKITEIFKTLNPGAPRNGVIHPKEKYIGKVELGNDTITIETKLILPIFRFTVNGVMHVLKSALAGYQKVQVFVSGGFSEFPLLQDAMEDNFPDNDFYFVENPRDVAMLGALVVGQEKETEKNLKSLPVEVHRLSMEHQMLYCDAVQRDRQVTNHISLTIIGANEVDKCSFIRSMVGTRKLSIRSVQNGLFAAYIGRSTGLRYKTCIFPAPRDWQEQQIQGISYMESIQKLQQSWTTSNENACRSGMTLSPNSVPSRDGNITSKERKERHSRQKTRNISLFSNSSSHSKSDSSVLSHEKYQPKPKSFQPSFGKNTSVLSSPPLPPISSRVEEETIVPCVFNFHDGWTYLYTQDIKARHDSIFLLIFSLDSDITANVTEAGLIDEWTVSTPLLEYLTTWTKHIYEIYGRTDAVLPNIIPFGIYADKSNSVNLMRTKYKMIINALRRSCLDDSFMDEAFQDYSLIAHIKDSSAAGYDNLRSTILDIYKASKAKSTVYRPTAWIYTECFIRRKKSAGAKILEKEEIRQSLSNDQTIEMTSDELEACLKYQHEIGAIIYYDSEGFRDTVILDPKWPLTELSNLIKKRRKMMKTNRGYESPFVLSKSLIDMHLNEVIHLTNKGRELLISFLQRTHCLCCPCLYDQNGQLVMPNFYVVPSILETLSSGGILESLFQKEKAIALRYHFKYVPLLTPIFHRLLGAAMTVWHVACHKGKEIMTNKYCAFVLDNFHRVVITVDKNNIIVAICNRQGNININPSICQNVQRYLRRILHDILEMGYESQISEAKNECFTAEVSTCTLPSPCYKSLNDLTSQETWRCDFHQIIGKSQDIMRVWFTHEEPIVLVGDSDYCETNCQGLSTIQLSKAPTEVVIGRLVRRLDINIIKQMAKKLGLAESIAYLIEKGHKQDTWRLGFHFLHESVVLLNKTYGHLVRVMEECNQDVHLLCRVMKRQKLPDLQIVADRLDTPVTAQELVSIANNISNDVFPLGIELGLNTDDIHRIIENTQEGKESLVVRKILLEWKEALTTAATFGVLSSSLAEVKLDSLCILNSVNVHQYNDLY